MIDALADPVVGGSHDDGTVTPLERGVRLAALLCGAWAAEPPPLTTSDIEHLPRLVSLSYHHGVAPLLWRRIRATSLAATSAGEDLQAAATSSLIAVLMQQDALARTVSLLRAEGIEPILLKGLAVARLYPAPSLRPGGDLDFWIRPRDIERARAVLIAAGCEPGYDHGIPFTNPNNFETSDGVQIDIKTDFGYDVISPSLHRRWWERATWETIAETSVRVLAPPDELIYLSIHAAKHTFGSAKWLVDIAAALAAWQTDRWGPPEVPAEQPARSWTLTALGLALDLLRPDDPALPPRQRGAARREAAPWRTAVLSQLGRGETSGAGMTLYQMLTHLRDQPSPAGAWRLLRMLWPDAIESAVYLKLPLRPAVAQPARALAFLHRRVWLPPQHLRAHLAMLRFR